MNGFALRFGILDSTAFSAFSLTVAALVLLAAATGARIVAAGIWGLKRARSAHGR